LEAPDSHERKMKHPRQATLARRESQKDLEFNWPTRAYACPDLLHELLTECQPQ